MTSRRFKDSVADKELAALRRGGGSTPTNGTTDEGGNGATSAVSSGVATMGLLRRPSGTPTTTTSFSTVGRNGSSDAASSSAATSALYNVLLRNDFRPEDAAPVLSRALAVQVKDLRRMESHVADDSEEINDYRYDEEKAFRDKLLGLGTVVGLLPPRKEMRDDGGGVGWSDVDQVPTHARPAGPMVDEDGNMACGTDDLEEYIQAQQHTKLRCSAQTAPAVVKTVAAIPSSVTTMALGTALDELIDRISAKDGNSRPVSAKGGLLLTTSSRGPPINVFQSAMRESTSESASATMGKSAFVPSPPRSTKPSTASGLPSGATRSSSSSNTAFDHDIYSVKPSSSGPIGLGSIGGGGGSLASLRSTRQAAPTLTKPSTNRAVVPPAINKNPKHANASQSATEPATTADPTLYVHTEYLGNNAIGFCPNCRHCVDLSVQKALQKVTATEQLVCPRCSQLWVDRTVVEEQKKIEDEESAAFQRAVLEWRNSNKAGGGGQLRIADREATSAATNGSSAGVGTDSKPISKGVRIPKGLYFQHLWKCVEAQQVS